MAETEIRPVRLVLPGRILHEARTLIAECGGLRQAREYAEHAWGGATDDEGRYWRSVAGVLRALEAEAL